MSKPIDPLRLKLESYPFHLDMDTQFGDMDVFGHVNNLAIARFYESARARIQMEFFGGPRLYKPDVPDMTVLAELNFRFLAECNFPQPVQVGTGLGRIGKSSFFYQQAVFQEGVCIGVCDAAMVFISHGKTTAIPEGVRSLMQGYLMPSNAEQ